MAYETLISTADLAQHLDDPAFVVVDCRHNLADIDAGERAYRAGHVPGAFFMHIDRDLSGAKTGRNGRHPLPEAHVLASTFGRAGIDSAKQVVAYDQNAGMWAARLWWLLRWLGHDQVAVLDGGFDKWLAEGRPSTGEVPAPRTARFTYKRSQPVASADEILRHIDDGALLILDARAQERYRGDVEPIDPVAGHIPGARNRPYTENLTPQTTFKSAALLRSEFEALLAKIPSSAVVHQCGSGVTACHTAPGTAAGVLPGPRLHPGSGSGGTPPPAPPAARA